MGLGAGGASAPQQVERTRLGSKPERREPPWSYISFHGTRIGPWQQGWRSKPIPISHLQKLAFVLPNVFQMGTQRENSLQPMGTGSSPLTSPHRAPQNPGYRRREQNRHPREGRQGWEQATASLTCGTPNPARHWTPGRADGQDSAWHGGHQITPENAAQSPPNRPGPTMGQK